jgi:hypothetical protein
MLSLNISRQVCTSWLSFTLPDRVKIKTVHHTWNMDVIIVIMAEFYLAVVWFRLEISGNLRVNEVVIFFFSHTSLLRVGKPGVSWSWIIVEPVAKIAKPVVKGQEFYVIEC